VKERFIRILRKKSVTAGMLVCLVVLSVVAVWKGSVKNSQVDEEYMEATQPSSSEVVVNAEVTESEATTEEESTKEENTQEESTEEVVALSFSEDTKISWPIEGEVLMEFSMDETIYHPTLNEYKCNEGIVIQSEEGSYVNSPTKCVVTKVGEDEEIGNYVELSLGNNYLMKIGQLEQIVVEEGDTLEEGDHIACTAKPTHYYSVEGDNVYLEILKDNQPQNPLNYLN
jgi:septal ring factor EnvC (AmiA/AmiB activator)